MSSCPVFCEFELMGDSMFLRFAREYSGSCSGPTTYGEWGLCKSGQNINGLCRQLQGYTPKRKACILIGTNDLLRITRSSVQLSKEIGRATHGMTKIANILQRKCETVALCTIPPVPRLESNSTEEKRRRYWRSREKINQHIRGLQNQKILVLEMGSLFVQGNGIRSEMFERVMGPARRPDLIHWNRKGMAMAGEFMLETLS